MTSSQFEVLDKEIMQDLLRVGISEHYNRLDLSRKDVASVALPVLASWIERLKPGHRLRHALYHCFGDTTMLPWFDQVLNWFKVEPDRIMKGYLASILARYCRPQHSGALLALCREQEVFEFRSEVLARISKYTQVREGAIQLALVDIEAGRPDLGDLGFYAKIKDPRIKQAVERSPIWQRALLASQQQRSASRRGPSIWKVADDSPDMKSEITSLGADLGRAVEWMESYVKSEGASIPILPLPRPNNLASWFNCDVTAASGATFRLWIRYGDVDALEVVVTHK